VKTLENKKEIMAKQKIITEKAVFGAGCFWHVQYAFSQLKGVLNTTVGYMGGDEKTYPNPKYEMLYGDKTGYAEVVLVEYNPNIISYVYRFKTQF
jgi:peptide-methionine (S)-S-oxide reductase